MNPSLVWRRSFSRRDPLTIRVARTVAEAESDPYSWWEAPAPAPRPRRRTVVDKLCFALGLALISAMLTSALWWPA